MRMSALHAGLALLAVSVFLPGPALASGTTDLDRLKLGIPVFGKAVEPKQLAGKVVLWRAWSG